MLNIGCEINLLAIFNMGLNIILIGALYLCLIPKVSFESFMILVFFLMFISLVFVDGYLLFELVRLTKPSALSTTHYVL
jgi:hypothetical protein